jgi:hypothetical protein
MFLAIIERGMAYIMNVRRGIAVVIEWTNSKATSAGDRAEGTSSGEHYRVVEVEVEVEVEGMSERKLSRKFVHK